MKYQEMLRCCVEKAAKRNGNLLRPIQFLKHLTDLQDPFIEVYGDIENLLYQDIKNEFNFVELAQRNNTSVSDQEIEKLIELFRWLLTGIKQFNFKKDSKVEIAAYLFTAGYLAPRENEKMLWQELSAFCCISTEFINGLVDLIKNTPPSSLLFYGLGARQHDEIQKILAYCEKCDGQANFSAIHSLFKDFTNIILPSTLFREAIICINYLSFRKLVDISHDVKSTIIALAIAQILPMTAKFLMAGQSGSRWIQFWSLYSSFVQHKNSINGNVSKKRIKENSRLGKNKRRYLLFALIQLLCDSKNLEHFVFIFQLLPNCYSCLQEVIGQALAKIPSDEIWKNYIENIKLNTDGVGGEQVSRCIAAFRSHANIFRREKFLMYCHERWLMFITNEKQSKVSNYFKPLQTNLDDAIVVYFVEFYKEEKINSNLTIILEEIKDLPNKWHESFSHFRSMYNLLITQCQPYFCALNFINKRDSDFSKKSYLLPDFIKQSHYYQIMFDEEIEDLAGDLKVG